MNNTNLRPRTRRKQAAKPDQSTDRKRKARTSTTEEGGNCLKKRTALPQAVKEMKLESDEISDASFNVSKQDFFNTSLNNLTVGLNQSEKRRRSTRQCNRQNELKKSTTQVNAKLPLTNMPPDINGITKFTFSNYFPPVSKDSTPLPHLDWADSREVWEVMLQKDREYKRDALYIRKHPSLQPRMRTVLLDWLIEVCEVYRLHRETFYLSVDYVDRYLSTQKNIAKTRLQLVGVTAIFVAAKMEEIYPPKLAEFAYVTDGACTDAEILQQEVLLLEALKWYLCPVTPISWLTAYLQIINRKMKQNDKDVDENFLIPQFAGIHLARITELIDLCCLDTGYLQFPYSIIAASALYHMWGKDATAITGHKFDELYPCIQWLVPFAKAIHTKPITPLKHFEKIPSENAHNIQVHNNAIQLLDMVHAQMSALVPINDMPRTSPLVKCKGILTPPQSTEKEFLAQSTYRV